MLYINNAICSNLRAFSSERVLLSVHAVVGDLTIRVFIIISYPQLRWGTSNYAFNYILSW